MTERSRYYSPPPTTTPTSNYYSPTSPPMMVLPSSIWQQQSINEQLLYENKSTTPSSTSSTKVWASPVKHSKFYTSPPPQQQYTTSATYSPNSIITANNLTNKTMKKPSISNTELTSSAAPFVPGGSYVSNSSGNSRKPSEKMVQVTRGGCIFFVPESQANSNVESIQQHSSSANFVNQEQYRSVPSLNCTQSNISTSSSPNNGKQNSLGGNNNSTRRRCLDSISLAENFRRVFDLQNEHILRQVQPNDERYKEIPSQFHCMWPLDIETRAEHRDISGSFGYASHCYKVVSELDGKTYMLRRIENVKTTPAIIQQSLSHWRKIQHPNLVQLHRIFLSHGHTLFYLTDFHPAAESLRSRFLVNKKSSTDNPPPLLAESLLWSFVCQLVSLVRSVHMKHQMAVRVLDSRRILISLANRLRVGGIGVLDVLEYDTIRTQKNIQKDQRNDLRHLAQLILCLGSRCVVTPTTMTEYLELFRENYSSELNALVLNLLSTQSPDIKISDVVMSISSHIMEELQYQYSMSDTMESQLSKEYQNGRLFLLLMKLGVINERPELNLDSRWSETGDRYLLKLFRDYVFHQSEENGSPVVDFGHIIDSLNKFDAGSPEEILLSSRDKQSILIASFKDIRQCAEKAFMEVLRAKTTSSTTSSPMKR